MLDGLEGGDGPAELLAHLGVVHGGVDAVSRPADRLSGQQGPGARQRRFPCPTKDVAVADADLLQVDTSGASGRIQVLRHLDRYTSAITFQHQHVVARCDQQQVAQAGAEHDPGLTVSHAVVESHLPAETDARGDGSVDQPWE